MFRSNLSLFNQFNSISTNTLYLSLPFFIDKYYRYLEDLYTLTYHEDSSIDQDENENKEIETFNNLKLSTGLTSLQVGSHDIKLSVF